ncbi:type II toxin-antitoxin system VapC family toxin [Microbacterium marinilacus]|uniref:Ribonuclease VapC n=1 Tax=Microbacterium marinilacus TaxID=415209 RepID=A0ABP7BER1_9MICO|nr:type II toxin-antitoxin system VapC family toxin [Microbacterium marinilacus]MBY0688964.1 type II toxin-antitoxin system VapC family toxin [Microbacterium marinilacus]
MRYLLDTNILSDHYEGTSASLDAWMSARAEDEIAISVITVLELDVGVRRAERRDPASGARLRVWLDDAVRPLFAGRILPVDERVALAAAGFQAPDPMPQMDALIAATALVHGVTLVTRNVKDVERTGIAILNPWDLGG